jgi:hypothetical protein
MEKILNVKTFLLLMHGKLWLSEIWFLLYFIGLIWLNAFPLNKNLFRFLDSFKRSQVTTKQFEIRYFKTNLLVFHEQEDLKGPKTLKTKFLPRVYN